MEELRGCAGGAARGRERLACCGCCLLVLVVAVGCCRGGELRLGLEEEMRSRGVCGNRRSWAAVGIGEEGKRDYVS